MRLLITLSIVGLHSTCNFLRLFFSLFLFFSLLVVTTLYVQIYLAYDLGAGLNDVVFTLWVQFVCRYHLCMPL